MAIEQFTWQAPGTWRKPCIVHVTMTAKDRQPLFGTLMHTGEKTEVEKSPLGWVLINEQKRLEAICPEIRIIADKVMPDHHHIVLHVTREMPRTIKEVVRGYMQGCKAGARLLGYTEPLFDGPPFFRVLTHRGQLDTMIQYVFSNAERAWVKHQHPDLFRLRRETTYYIPSPSPTCYVSSAEIVSPSIPLRFSSLGNHFLLEWPDRQLIEISRSANERQIEDIVQNALNRAKNGAITITAAISEGERRVARVIREAGFPLVVLLTDGFPQPGTEAERYYKPGGVYFEACAAGKLLLLEPTVEALAQPLIIENVDETLRQKAEQKHLSYTTIPRDSKRWRFVANNEIGRLLTNAMIVRHRMS